jgi:PAS domain S-box-containing protein
MARRRTGLEGRWQPVAELAVVGVAYFVAARLSLHLSLVRENITPLWPPTGIALVAFLLRGRRVWPAVTIAALFVNLPISATPVAAAVTAVGNTLAPLLATTLLQRVGFDRRLERVRDAIAIVFLGALLSTAVSATIGSVTLLVSGSIERADLLSAWSVWWAGDAMGILVVAPFLLAAPALVERPFLLGRQGVETLAVLGLIAGVALVVLSVPQPVLFAVLPVIGLASWRLQQRGAAPAALLVSLLATWAAVGRRGPFAGLELLPEMLTLQAFNASVALTSFFFAAMVSERVRARRELERSAAALEDRVEERTAELSAASDRLAEAQRLARLGFWEWDLASGKVLWSGEMYRIYGVPEGQRITFERAIELVVPEDRAQIQANVAGALRDHAAQVPDVEYRVVRGDGSTATLHGKARAIVEDGVVVRMLGTVQDVSERRELEREHRISDTLQRALLPQRLPEVPGITFASRYQPAEEGSSAGGDWYDVIELPDGTVAMVIGDVAGHGIEAASVMGQVRTAVRAFGIEGHRPAAVVGLVHDLLRSVYGGDQMVTMLYAVVDPLTLEARMVNAGHLPPMVIGPETGVGFVEGSVDLPLGLSWELPYGESVSRLRSGDTLVLYTDGLVDRRDVSVDDGLARLRSAANELQGIDVDDLCGGLIDALVPSDASDDVAILAATLVSARDRFSLRVPADPGRLRSVRRRVDRWLSSLAVDPDAARDIVLACSEACANAIEHAYGARGGVVEIDGQLIGGDVEIVVRDGGRWRPSRDNDRGRGLSVIRASMDHVEIARGDEGTEVRMRRDLLRTSP